MVEWLTVLIAFVVACFTGMQWFVLRQKIILDLFDRRFSAYNATLDAVRPILAAGNADDNAIRELAIAVHNSKFLFGSDVNSYLQDFRTVVAKLKYGNSIYNTAHVDAHQAPDIIHECSLKIIDFFEVYPKLCQPYMMMPEKRVRTTVEWFNDRNNLRKSYGHEPKNGD